MDGLTLFGLFAVTAMLVSYALEAKSHWYIPAFAIACGLGSIYGFLQGEWWRCEDGRARGRPFEQSMIRKSGKRFSEKIMRK